MIESTNNFTDRLREYRLREGFYKKGKFAEVLGVTQQLYASVESGYKKPSKDFIDRLVHHSNKDEAYWLYGVRDDFKTVKQLLSTMNKQDLIRIGLENLDEGMKDKLLRALMTDVLQMGFNKKNGE